MLISTILFFAHGWSSICLTRYSHSTNVDQKTVEGGLHDDYVHDLMNVKRLYDTRAQWALPLQSSKSRTVSDLKNHRLAGET